jgi:flagellin
MPVINTNLAANSALRYVNINSNAQSKFLQQLSSGLRINRASDDAASLSIATRVKADNTALGQAAINGGTAQAVLSIAEGGLFQVANVLQRLKAITTNAQSGILGVSEFANLNKEYQALILEVTAIAQQTKFNGVSLLDGAAATGFANAAGANVVLGSVSGDLINITISGAGAGNNATAGAAGLNLLATAITTAAQAALNQANIDTAINTNAGLLANVGAASARVGFRSAQIDVSVENGQGAVSALLEADVARAQTDYTNADVLTQSGIAALQKANSQKQALLRLLQS